VRARTRVVRACENEHVLKETGTPLANASINIYIYMYIYIYIYIYIGTAKPSCGMILLSRPMVNHPVAHVTNEQQSFG
jgi:hypothetical protein